MKSCRSGLLHAMTFLITGTAFAAVAPMGSLITSGAQVCLFPVCGPSFRRLDAFTPQGSFIRTITSSDTSPDQVRAIASDRLSNLVGVGDRFDIPTTLVRVNDDGTTSAFSSQLTETGRLSLDASGNIYMGLIHILKFSPSGQLL